MNRDGSASEIATLGANKQSYTMTAAGKDIRTQHARYSAIEATGCFSLKSRVRKRAAHVKAGRLSSFEEGQSVD
jgi:hypothetical protein